MKLAVLGNSGIAREWRGMNEQSGYHLPSTCTKYSLSLSLFLITNLWWRKKYQEYRENNFLSFYFSLFFYPRYHIYVLNLTPLHLSAFPDCTPLGILLVIVQRLEDNSNNFTVDLQWILCSTWRLKMTIYNPLVLYIFAIWSIRQIHLVGKCSKCCPLLSTIFMFANYSILIMVDMCIDNEAN